MRERQAATIYKRELFGALAIYTGLLFAALRYGPLVTPGIWRTLALACPMLGFVLGIWAVARGFSRMDEYIRLRSLENMAIAAAVTAGCTFTYGFLENADYPKLTMFVVWPVMGTAWGLVAIARRLAGR